jgi:hypothetical protein
MRAKSIGAALAILAGAVLFPAPTAAADPDAAPPAALNPVPLREFKNGANYLYTAYWPEIQSVPNYGFTATTQRQIGFVFARDTDDTYPIYRLRQNSTGRYIFSVYQPEIDRMVSNGFTMEGTIGYLYAGPHYGAQEIRRYRKPDGWRLAYASQHAQLTSAGYSLDGTMGYMLPTYYKVGAYYFGTWDANTSPQFLDAIENYFGRRDPWGGVRDFHGDPDSPWGPVVQNTQGWAGDFSHLKPSIGYYDDSQVHTLETQIDQAASAGLSYFSFYDYWDNQAQTTQIDTGLKTFLQASNRDRMEFMLSIVLPPDGGTDPQHLKLPRSQFALAADSFSEYTTEPNYLRTQDGRPLVFLLDSRGIGDGSIADQNEWTALLRQQIQAKTGVDPYILVHSEYGTEYAEQLDGEGYTCLAIGSGVASGSYNQYWSEIPGYFSHFDSSKPTARCVMSGFDERPRLGFWIQPQDLRRFTDDSRAQFPQALSAVRGSMDSAPMSPIDNLVTVYAWNEWHEGGVIEPNDRDGNYYLDALTSEFQLTWH